MSRNLIAFLIILIFLCMLVIGVLLGVPALANRQYGPPSPELGFSDQFQFSARLLWYGSLLTQPLDSHGSEQPFTIESGESVPSIAIRLEEVGIIRSAAAFRAYLIYTGLDTSIQAGDYLLSPAQSIIDIARKLQDATPEQITFVVLPGWRIEEIAVSLSTSGLNISLDEFLTAARSAPPGLDFLPASASTEGFLYPDTYMLPRETTAEELVREFLRNFSLHLTGDLREGFARQGLDVYQAVTLASIVQREAVVPEERAQIASVFFNRLRADVKLDTDPSVQYALGFNTIQNTWWTNPLSAADLQIDSPYNTYLYPGLPPTPIANPSLSALQAVAFPAETPYYYFRARCDGSGLHDFAVTFEEHLQNGCQ
ncbi:MAG: endolytic transglycosylase MltG [Anaerolineales bacterium]